MSDWAIEYWVDSSNKPDVKDWLDSLTNEQLKSVSQGAEAVRAMW